MAKIVTEKTLPYVVEYNGSEVLMNASYSRVKNLHETDFIRIEQMIFRQATYIIAVSETIANYLMAFGVDARKILVNPNGADPVDYFPSESNYQSVRQKCGWREDDVVIGFVGTFGGWHGIDVITDVIQTLMNENNKVYFMLIGDGENFPALLQMIAENQLEHRVKLFGLMDKTSSIYYLQACDIYLSPQTNTIQGSEFYGSPVKLFEYMSLGKAIIASDLMQIGQVLQPAFHAKNLSCDGMVVTDQTAILIEPGNIPQCVIAIRYLIKYPQVRKLLGNNAREVLLKSYTWKKHVERIIAFISAKPNEHWLLPQVVNSQGQYLHTLRGLH